MAGGTTADLDRRLRRLERIAALTFTSVFGDRGFGSSALRRYPCPGCGGDGRLEGFECPRCGGKGDISPKQKAAIDVYEILQESAEPVLETR